MNQSFDRRKALETFGTGLVFSEAIQAYTVEVKNTIAKLERATETLNPTDLLSSLHRLESGLRYLHAEPALRTLRNLRARVSQRDLEWDKVSEEFVKLRSKLSALLFELREGLGSRGLRRND